MDCCGQPRIAPFGPDGDEKTEGSSLDDLLAHCRAEAERLLTRAENMRLFAEHPSYVKDVMLQRAEQADADAVRWRQWTDALQDLIHA